ncbi:hypothetical protein [Lentzea sp. NBRC 102530]|uniref:hypothetical protein n=1 Tax=Lentzea sp. NBRC 102530 TaxID=3032201 RepID=UPI0024A4DECA|nr:hypothetical protein [Lentzea sp. NBRC 102530]GLY52330.1 hypothetical protein Lesp01_59860 [Lentzea sp. NBRC 102530]
MQRPAATTGRRHNRAGSISVAELIKQQPTSIRILSNEDAATDALVTSLLGPTENMTATTAVIPVVPGRRRRTATPSRAGRVAGLVTGAVLLVSSIAGAAILAGKRPENVGVPVSERPVALSGSSALRPDVLSAQLPNDRPPPQTTDAAVPMPQPSALLLEDNAQQESAAQATSEPATPEVSVGPLPQVDVVKKFYELLTTKPGAAAKLLSPELVGGNPAEFVQSWGKIKTVNVDQTSVRPDGSVLAVVSMQEADGSWLRIEQLFWLTSTTQPRIVGTEVLSAQRS